MVDKVLFSSESEEWQTPKILYDRLDEEFAFGLDPCTTMNNPLGTSYFYTKEDNGLDKKWFGSVFVNPPYNTKINEWLYKAYNEFINKRCHTIVFLLPARTDTKWFHKYIYNQLTNRYYPNVSVRFIMGRLKFNNSKNSAPFPSMIVIFSRY